MYDLLFNLYLAICNVNEKYRQHVIEINFHWAVTDSILFEYATYCNIPSSSSPNSFSSTCKYLTAIVKILIERVLNGLFLRAKNAMCQINVISQCVCLVDLATAKYNIHVCNRTACLFLVLLVKLLTDKL